MMRVKLRETVPPKITREAPPPPCCPTWYKASEIEKHEHTNLLHEKIQNLKRPSTLSCEDVHYKCPEHTVDRDRHVLDVMSAAIEASHQAIPTSGAGGGQGRKSSRTVPSWKKLVAPQQSDALFWHGVWKSAGRPNAGHLFNVMKHTRNKYHYAIRRAERECEALRASQLREAAASGDMALIAELKKTLSPQKGGQQVAESLEGEVTEDGILLKF